jgi:hypothetical protein
VRRGRLLPPRGHRARFAACGARRRRKLREADPVVRLRLSDALRERLAQAAALHGPALQAAGAAMDPALASQLHAAVGGA